MSKHNVYAKELSNPQYKQRIVGAKKVKLRIHARIENIERV